MLIRSSRRITIILLPIILLMLLLVNGCSWWNQIKGKIDWAQREFSNTEDILNRAMADIDANSQNWQRIMQKALDDLNPAERQVRQDLEELMQRGIHTSGLEARCDISYLGDMLIQSIKRIRATLRNEAVPPLQAVVCDASPSAIDMNLDPNRRNNVEVYGYNLDMGWLKLYHVMSSTSVNETAHFSITSPFKRVINMGLNGIALVPSSVKLKMDLGNGTIREIPVIQQWPSICATKDFNTPSASIQVIPVHTGPGDNEFAGNGPCIRATAQIYTAANGTELRARVNVDMWECPDDMSLIRKDYTEGIGIEDRVLYTADHGWTITEVRSPMSAVLEFIGQGTNPQSKTDTGLVLRWNILGDTESDDIGKSYVTTTFNSVHLVLRENINCVTEDELARLMQQNAMSDKVRTYLVSKRPQILDNAKKLQQIMRQRYR